METRIARYRTGTGMTARRWPYLLPGSLLAAVTIGNIAVGNTNIAIYIPLALGIPLLLIGIFRMPAQQFFRSTFGKIVKGVLIIGYCAVIAAVTASVIAVGGELAKKTSPGADAIIVLGAAVHGDEVTDALEKRLLAAKDYYDQNPGAVFVLSGGMGTNEDLSEALAMQKYLLALGVPEDALLLEERAENTQENFMYSKQLLDERFGENAYSTVFVTSDYHVLRARKEAEKAGLTNVQGIGAPTPILTVPVAWIRESAALARGLLRGDMNS